MAARRTRTAPTGTTNTAPDADTMMPPSAPTVRADAVGAAPVTDAAPVTAPAPMDTTAPVPAGDDTASAQAAPTLSPEAIQAAMQIMAGEADRRTAAAEELAKAQVEEETRRQKVLADLAKARTTEETRAALGTLLAAVTTTYLAVTNGDEDAATAGLEVIYTATADVRRTSRNTPARTTTATGTTTGRVTVRSDRTAPRPLRPEVAAHLTAYPGKDFTPSEIAKVLGRSSGAVSNALDSLVKAGEAALTGEKPHRYRAAATTVSVA